MSAISPHSIGPSELHDLAAGALRDALAGGAQVAYTAWPALPDLFPIFFPGIRSPRVGALDRETAEGSHAPGGAKSIGNERPATLPVAVLPYLHRPFDVRWLEFDGAGRGAAARYAEFYAHCFEGNLAFTAAAPLPNGQSNRAPAPPLSAGDLFSLQSVERGASIFPLYLQDETRINLFAEEDGPSRKPNLSSRSRGYLHGLDREPLVLFLHSLAVQHAPLYRLEYAAELQLGWPRIPLPGRADILDTSAALGAEVAGLLDVLHAMPGVTATPLRSELRSLAKLVKTDNGIINPLAGQLGLVAPWGGRNAAGATVPGKGKWERRLWYREELAGLHEGAAKLGLTTAEAQALLGEWMFDIYLSDLVLWRGVPSKVWSYAMGGHSVLKKWLSYRSKSIIERDLTIEETREAQNIVRRISALLLLQPRLNANYQVCRAEALSWYN